MHISSKRGIFPWFTIMEGIAGFFMQCWLFSATDAQGLLPRYHFAGILSFLLLALTLGICFIGARKEPEVCPDRLFLAYPPAATGIAIAAVGFAVSAFTVSGFGFLQIITPFLGVVAAAALMYVAYCRFKGLQADCLLYCTVTIYLILHTMSCCSTWGTQTQLLRYFFPLLASILLLISSYYRAVLAMGKVNYKRYVFFSQAALFCCSVSCLGSNWLFYLSAAFWLSWDFPAPSSVHTGRFMQ